MIILKKNGCTIVELLTVIIVLSVIMVFAVSIITSASKNAENKLDEIERKNLIEAGKMLAIDLDDNDSEIYNCSGWITRCNKNSGKWTRVTITVSDLVSHNYFTDNRGHIDGTIKIIIYSFDSQNNSDYYVTIDEN